MLVILSLEANILFSTKDTREYFFIYQVLLAPSFLSLFEGAIRKMDITKNMPNIWYFMGT